MILDLQRILDSKRVHRARLAAHPIAEKLRLLDALRQRETAIRGNVGDLRSRSNAVREESVTYRTNPE